MADDLSPIEESRSSAAGRRRNLPLDFIFDTAAQRNFIYIVALAAAGSLVVAYFYSVATHPVDWIRHVAFILGMAAFVGAAVSVRLTGSIAVAGSILVLAGAVMTLVPAYFQGGVSAAFSVWFLVIPLLSGLVVGARMALVTGILGIAAMSVLAFLENTGALPDPSSEEVGNFLVFLNLVLGIFFSTAVGTVSARSLVRGGQRLQEAKTAEAAKALALEESTNRVRASIDAALDAIVVVDAENQIVEFNPAAEHIFGRARSGVLGKVLPTLLIPERLRASHLEGFARYQRTGKSTILGSKIETTALRGDGSEFPIEMVVQPVVVSKRSQFTAYVRDLTEQRAAEEELRRKNQQLAQGRRLEAIGRLAGGVAHDFNNVLTAINGYAELLLNRSDLDANARTGLEQIAHAGAQARALTQQLLAFSRSDRLESEVVDPNEMISGLLNMMDRVLSDSIVLDAHLGHGVGLVKTDGARLEQALLNLVLNAGDAMPEGGQLTLSTATVDLDEDHLTHLEGLRPGRYVRISVRDTGIGMDAHTAGKVFEPFFTTKAIGEGTGLGLATAYGTIRQSGGAMTLDTHPGGGTTFEIFLPRFDGNLLVPERPPMALRAGHGETLLVVEDQMGVRELVKNTLEDMGYRVLTAQDGEDALDCVSRYAGEVDLMVTDVVMPRLGGPEAVRRLRAVQPKLKVVYVSGYSEEDLAMDDLAEPGTLFLRKPFGLEELCRAVQSLLDEPLSEGVATGDTAPNS